MTPRKTKRMFVIEQLHQLDKALMKIEDEEMSAEDDVETLHGAFSSIFEILVELAKADRSDFGWPPRQLQLESGRNGADHQSHD